MGMLIAVYGTLRRGHGNNGLLRGSEFVGEGKTVEEYTMRAGGIPYVGKTPRTRIKVEVFDVPEEDVPSVDGLEGHPDWYRREEIPVELDNGEVVNAWLYFMETSSGEIVESGDFADYTYGRRRFV